MTFWELISKFDKIWKQFGLHFGIPNPPKSKNIVLPRGSTICSIFIQIFIGFWLNFGALLEPCSPPRDPQDGPRAAQDAFRRRLGGVLEPGAAQEAARPPPGLDSGPPDLDFGASRPAFWEDFTCNMLIRWFFLWRSSVPECT